MNAAPRGLGKGLSALMGEDYSQTATATPSAPTGKAGNAPQTMAVGKIVSGKFQPRQQFHEDQLRELADSIAKNGIMQPIIVRPIKGGMHEIVAGERRWRAAKLAGMENVPVISRELTDQQALELALVENIQRMDLTPLEEAGGYQRLIDEFKYTQEELANTVGKSRSHITNLLRLQSLPDEIKEMLEEGTLTMGHARALLTVANPIELAKEIVRRGLNVRQVEHLIREVTETPATKRPRAGSTKPGRSAAPQAAAPAYTEPANKDSDILALEESLSENLGLKVSINDRGHAGEIIVVYNSLTQLDEILRRLGGSI